MAELNLLITEYKAHHDCPGKIEEFYQYLHDLADYKTIELVLDHIWPIELRLHGDNDLETVKCIQEEIRDPNLRFWVYDHLGDERGAIYKTKKCLFQCFVEPCYVKKHKCCKVFTLGLIVLKHFLFSILKCVFYYKDTFKDLILITILWHMSNNILVSDIENAIFAYTFSHFGDSLLDHCF